MERQTTTDHEFLVSACHDLTVAEACVLARVARGCTDDRIAEDLKKSLASIRSTLRRFRDRTGLAGRALAVWAAVHDRCCISISSQCRRSSALDAPAPLVGTLGERNRRYPMERRITRRRALQSAVAAGAAGAAAAAGIKGAQALAEWDLASPIYGQITTGWHSGALDIAGRAGSTSVYAYFRRGTAAYGYIEVTNIRDSCEAPSFPTHKIVDFYLRTDGLQSYVGSALAQHVESVGVAKGSLYQCPVWIAAQATGSFYSYSCYTGPHVHYWANGTQVGNPQVNDLTYLDSPIFWKWNV